MKITCLCFIILSVVSLNALKFDKEIILGVKWKSALNDQYPVEKIRLDNPDFYAENGFVASTALDLGLFTEGDAFFSICYMFHSDTAFTLLNYSKLNHHLVLNFFDLRKDDLSYRFSLLFHHGVEDYKSPVNTIVDTKLTGGIYYDGFKTVSLSAEADLHYFKEPSEHLLLRNGPGFQIRAGAAIFPGVSDHVIDFTLGFEMNFFYKKKVSYRFRDDVLDGLISINNRNADIFIRNRTLFVFKHIETGLEAKYSYRIWLDKDSHDILFWDEEVSPIVWKKKRIDHYFIATPSFYYVFFKGLKLGLYYSFEIRDSNFGKSENDYVDYSFIKHSTGLMLNYEF